MASRRAWLLGLLAVAFVVLPRVPGLLLAERPPVWLAHALTHALGALVAGAASIVAAPLPRLASSRPRGALARVGWASVSLVALAQAGEAVSAYTEREGAGALHAVTSALTLTGVGLVLAAAAIGLVAALAPGELPRWAWWSLGAGALLVVAFALVVMTFGI